MANRFAIANGNFADTATWATTYNGAGGASVPGAGDSAMANNKTVNITANVTCTDLRNDTQGSAVGGGGFVITNGNVTADASTDIVTTATAHGLSVGDQIVFTSLVGGTGLVSGTTYRVHADNFSTTQFKVALNADGATLVDITSNIVSGIVSKSGLIIVANCYGTQGAVMLGFSVLSSAVLVGSMYSTSSGTVVVKNSGPGTLSITGSAYGGGQSQGLCVLNSGAGSILFTGNAYGNYTGASGADGSHGIVNSGAGSVTITGNAYGCVSGGIGHYGVANKSTGVISIFGDVVANMAPGAVNSDTGVFTIAGSIFASTTTSGFVSPNASAANRISGNIYNAANGMQAIYTARYSLITTPTNTVIRQSLDGVSTFLNYYQDGAASSQSGQPAAADVRYGTTYGPTASLTGTCHVPAASSVAYGALTDNTTGTAILTADAVWNALTSTMNTSGSIGERLKNAATVATTGAQLAAM